MIEVKPSIQHHSNCPHCRADLKNIGLVWHGMHICVESKCVQCNTLIIEDLRVGHAIKNSYQIDLKNNLLFGNEQGKEWLGKPLLKSLQEPQSQIITITKEVYKESPSVIILNCIDFLYGHCLLKLLNAQRHIDNYSNYGLVVVVPTFLRWMVPDGVAEIWKVDIPLKCGQNYYLKFHQFMSEEIRRFDKVYVSKAYSHPNDFNITRFTKVSQHSFNQAVPNITFIWREDRIWINPIIFSIMKKLNIFKVALVIQNWKIRQLFKSIKFQIPSVKFTIAGLGTLTNFPEWIEDARVHKFDEQTEKQLCQIYSDSRLVIGIHGSNMLIPSGHAGMTIDLMPKDRWGNFAQDILYQEKDPRLAAFKYRYLPNEIKINQLAYIAYSMISKYQEFVLNMDYAQKKL